MSWIEKAGFYNVRFNDNVIELLRVGSHGAAYRGHWHGLSLPIAKSCASKITPIK